MHRNAKHILTAISSLIIFLNIQVVIPYYSHFHIIDGTKIVHSHPFSKHKAHSHNANELLIIELANHSTAEAATNLQLSETYGKLLPETVIYDTSDTFISVFTGIPLHRGPPVSLS